MNELTVAVEAILTVCGGIVAIGGATAVIIRWMSPFRKVKDRLTVLEKRVEEQEWSYLAAKADNERRFKQDLDALKDLETSTRLNLRVVMALLDHAVTGNGNDHMRELKAEVEKYLVER